MGWVSLFDPGALARLLEIPAGAEPVAVLCLGQVQGFYPASMLELEGWSRRARLQDMVLHNRWRNTQAPS
jgi:5,6-dimethylbenzimidazole synthase